MKKLLPFVLIIITLFTYSQDIKRETVSGKIIVEGNDLEGITIYNYSTSIGSVTNENGQFTIAVALNDSLEIRALEYKKLNVTINNEILDSKKINIFLIEEINKLDEVVLKTKRLTGNLKTDINRLEKFKPKRNDIYFGIKNSNTSSPKDTFNSEAKIADVNLVPQTFVDGLNIINVVDQLLIPIFISEVKDKKAAGIPEVQATSIKYYLGSKFLIDNFNIPEHRVEEFIRYVEDEVFDFDLLNYGHEIEFLELLNTKSKIFLKPKSDID
jgi:hypothetical protein